MASDFLSRTFSLHGRVALVTGASRGLGHAIAVALAGAGATVVLNGRDRHALDAVSAALPGSEVAAFDVTDEAAGKAAIEAIVARHGRLDILVANAGINRRHKLAEFPTEDWDAVIATNLTAPFLLAREAARPMVAQGWGRIVMNASMMGPKIARPTVAAYVAAKAGLSGLTRGLAVELAPKGVTCNAIAPGYFATEMNTALMADAAFTEFVARRTPAGRWARPEEIGGAAVFLASEAASYVTGHTLLIDGGLTAAL